LITVKRTDPGFSSTPNRSERIWARLGNPFFYSGRRQGRPENATHTVAKYTGYRSDEPGLALVLERMAINRELKTIRDRLLALHNGVAER
jgi:hypothetical protein